MNSVSPSVVDQWIAFELSERETGIPKKEESSPEQALLTIQSMGLSNG